MNGLIKISSPAQTWPQRALAFARSTEPRSAPSRRAVAIDALLAVAAALLALSILLYDLHMQNSVRVSPHRMVLIPVNGRLEWMRAHPAQPAGVDLVAVFFALLTTLPLGLRRVVPITAFWVILLGAATYSAGNNTVTILVLIFAAYSAVVHSRFRGAAILSVLGAGLLVTALFPDTAPPLPERFAALLILVPVTMVGSGMHRWRRRAGDSDARLQTIHAEHEAATRQALAAERARIAAELHDVVTHNVSVMVVQAGAARRVLAGSPADARAALLAVEACGRSAMVELQHLLGVLAPLDGVQADVPDRQPGQPDPRLLRPQPGLDQLQPLVDRVAATGLPVELIVTGEPQALPPGVSLTAYRVVQEGLTNAMKHAGPARAVIRLHYDENELVVEVSDDGPGGQRSSSRTAPGAVTGSGRGLLGLHERVSLYGGEFDAGPRPLAGWRVIAQLPLEAQPAGIGEVRALVPASP